jgi:hypothetical protein
MNQANLVVIPVNTINATLQYLSTKPYNEVVALIQALQNVQAYSPLTVSADSVGLQNPSTEVTSDENGQRTEPQPA